MEVQIKLSKKDPEFSGNDYFEKLRFCAIATRERNDLKYDLRCIRIKDGFCEGTDGHRYHLTSMKDFDFEDGFYEIKKVTKTTISYVKRSDDVKFPHTERLYIDHVNFGEVNLYSDFDISLSQVIRGLSFKNTINIEYFKDVFDHDCCDKFYYYGENRPMTFISREFDYLAIIMPLNV